MIKKLTFLGVLGMLCLQCLAQNEAIRPLIIGDTVPDIVFSHVLNYKDTTARLSDFKGKLVILDFWATWCGACLESMPETEKIQKKYKDDYNTPHFSDR